MLPGIFKQIDIQGVHTGARIVAFEYGSHIRYGT